jgi:hypothetical protein
LCDQPEKSNEENSLEYREGLSLCRLSPFVNSSNSFIIQYRAESLSVGQDFIDFEWLSLDLIFFSMMTSLIRLSATSNEPNAYFSCLENSRKCLGSMIALLDLWDKAENPDLYASSLTW